MHLWFNYKAKLLYIKDYRFYLEYIMKNLDQLSRDELKKEVERLQREKDDAESTERQKQHRKKQDEYFKNWRPAVGMYDR